MITYAECEIWDFHRDENSRRGPLDCDTVPFSGTSPTVQERVESDPGQYETWRLEPFSGLL
jgi:hypothetical protein